MSRTSCERIDPKQNLISYDRFLHLYRYEIVRKYAQDSPGQASLLDCACGNGYGAELLKGCASYTGVDVSSEAIDFALTAYAKYGTFHLYDGVKLPFQEGQFDIVSSLETIEHLSRDKHRPFISELLRILKSGGKIIITTPNRNYLYKKHLIRKGWTNPYHKYEYNFSEFLAFIKSFPNVTVKKAYVIGLPLPLPMRFLHLYQMPYYVARYIANMWISLGVCCWKLANSIILIAEKK